MDRPHPVRWLSDQGRTGLRELPSNAAWLASQVARPGEAAATGTRERARRLKDSVTEAAPGGESIDKKLKRARAAARRAQESEEEALEVASWSEERSERVRDNTRRLYMAMTRAGQRLLMTHVGPLPEVLDRTVAHCRAPG